MGTLLLRDAVVVTVNAKREVLERASIFIRDGHIAGIGDPSDFEAADETLDCRRKIVMPGLVDLHGYLGGSIMRSLGETHSPKDRRELIENIMSHCIDLDYWRTDAQLGALEKLRFGTTCMFSMVGGNGTRTDRKDYVQVATSALNEIGMRARIGLGPARPGWPRKFTNWEDGKPLEISVTFEEVIDNCDQLLADWRANPSELVDYCVALSRFGNRNEHDPVWDSEKEKWVGRQAEASLYLMQKYDVGFWTHAYGNAVEFAHDENLGLLGPRTVLSHCTDISERAIQILAETGTHVAHHPRAARIYSSPGRAPIPELLEAGVNVCLGSDAPANHDCDLFKDIKFATIAQRMHFKNQKLLPPETTLEMATINGYRALGLDDVLGSIEVGKLADVIVIDMDQPHLVPLDLPVHRIANHISGHDVQHVIVNGRVVVRDRKLTTMDGGALLERSEELYSVLLDRAGLHRQIGA